MKCYFKPSALKDLKRFPRDIQQRILVKLEFYASAGDMLRFAEKLKDAALGEWRFRIGDYRIFFDIQNDKIIVLKIGHRKDVYK